MNVSFIPPSSGIYSIPPSVKPVKVGDDTYNNISLTQVLCQVCRKEMRESKDRLRFPVCDTCLAKLRVLVNEMEL